MVSACPYGGNIALVTTCQECGSLRRTDQNCPICGHVIVYHEVTQKDYLMGRDVTHSAELTDDILRNIREFLPKINALIREVQPFLPTFEWKINSGWRPPSLNASVPGAATHSRHCIGQAIDFADPLRSLGEYLAVRTWLLSKHQLAMEALTATTGSNGTWCHLQSPPPASGHVIFHP